MEQEIDRFEAASDGGEMFVVIVYQETREHRGLTSIGFTKRLPRMALSDGRAVTPIDAETFKIAEADLIIRKVG